MALGGVYSLGKVLEHEGQGDAVPSGKIAGVDGLSSGGYHGDKIGAV